MEAQAKGRKDSEMQGRERFVDNWLLQSIFAPKYAKAAPCAEIE